MEKRNISDVIIFDGSLNELNKKSGYEYIAVGGNFIGDAYPLDCVFAKTQIELMKAGYEAIVNARLYPQTTLLSILGYYSGIPVIRKSRMD